MSSHLPDQPPTPSACASTKDQAPPVPRTAFGTVEAKDNQQNRPRTGSAWGLATLSP